MLEALVFIQLESPWVCTQPALKVGPGMDRDGSGEAEDAYHPQQQGNSPGIVQEHEQQQRATPEEPILSSRDALWFLDSLELYHYSLLTRTELRELEQSQLRAKPKHRMAILFQDDRDFLIRGNDVLVYDPAAHTRAVSVSAATRDHRVFLIHEALKIILRAYRRSRENAAPKSCIWSALMYRTAYFLRKSGFQDVMISENVQGVQHREATLFLQGYHISRSNFTKLARQFLKKGLEPSPSSLASVQQQSSASSSSSAAAMALHQMAGHSYPYTLSSSSTSPRVFVAPQQPFGVFSPSGQVTAPWFPLNQQGAALYGSPYGMVPSRNNLEASSSSTSMQQQTQGTPAVDEEHDDDDNEEEDNERLRE